VTVPPKGSTESTEPVGSLAQETVKLLRALAAERMRTSDETAAEPGPATSEHICTTGWCPICQVVGYVHDHPELVEQVTETVTDAAVQVGRAVREFLDKTLPPER
jgi:hypothetical protein